MKCLCIEKPCDQSGYKAGHIYEVTPDFVQAMADIFDKCVFKEVLYPDDDKYLFKLSLQYGTRIVCEDN